MSDDLLPKATTPNCLMLTILEDWPDSRQWCERTKKSRAGNCAVIQLNDGQSICDFKNSALFDYRSTLLLAGGNPWVKFGDWVIKPFERNSHTNFYAVFHLWL